MSSSVPASSGTCVMPRPRIAPMEVPPLCSIGSSMVHSRLSGGKKNVRRPAAPLRRRTATRSGCDSTTSDEQILDLDWQLSHADAGRVVHGRLHGGGEARQADLANAAS